MAHPARGGYDSGWWLLPPSRRRQSNVPYAGMMMSCKGGRGVALGVGRPASETGEFSVSVVPSGDGARPMRGGETLD